MRVFRIVLLYPFAVIYDLITSIRNKLFDFGILKSKRPDQFTISVGNLSVGGTGKTPFIKYLIQNLQDKNAAVLSRGYGRKTKGFIEVTPVSNASEVGDEPQMIKETTNAAVFVCENRVLGAKKIFELNSKVDVLLLDDAFQHRYIKPHLNLLLTPFANPFTRDFLLPAGNLREARRGAKRADLIIITKVPLSCSKKEIAAFMLTLSKQLKVKKPIFFCQYINSDPVNEAGEKLVKGEKVILVSGIANDISLRQFASDSYEVVAVYSFKDHYSYTKDDVLSFFDISATTKILTTAKDYTKLKDICTQDQLSRLFQTETQVKFVDQEEKFKAIVLNAFEAHT